MNRSRIPLFKPRISVLAIAIMCLVHLTAYGCDAVSNEKAQGNGDDQDGTAEISTPDEIPGVSENEPDDPAPEPDLLSHKELITPADDQEATIEVSTPVELPRIAESEPNNALPEADVLEPDVKGAGVLTSRSDDKDYWEFAVPQSSHVSIHCRVIDPEKIRNGLFGKVSLMNSEGKQITKDSNTDNYYSIEEYLSPGTYYLSHSLTYGVSGKYEIWFSSDPATLDEREPNNATIDANVLDPSATGRKTGILTMGVDEEGQFIYTFS